MENGNYYNISIPYVLVNEERDQDGKMTVTEKIGNEYMQWEAGSKVFISAPTGSGKTYFILHKLLPYVAQRDQRILYLVNRIILKEQLDRGISKIPSDYMCSIQIVLYQAIESYILYSRLNELQKLVNEYDYVICDVVLKSFICVSNGSFKGFL